MVSLWGIDTAMVSQVEQALEGIIPCERSIDWSSFEDSLTKAKCSVLLIEAPLEARVTTLLTRLRSPTETALPIVVVNSHPAYGSQLRHLACAVISKAEVAELLLDSIPQESARAALRFLRMKIEGARMSTPLRRALMIATRQEEALSSVRQLATRVPIGQSTLEHQWARDGLIEAMQASLKDYMDTVLLLKCRARKTPRLAWREIADEYGVSLRRLQTTSRRLGGAWFGDRWQIGWLTLASRVRSAAVSISAL